MALGGVGQAGNKQYLGRLGFGVGNKEFLLSSESRVAKYWRSIEYGLDTQNFVGRYLVGAWSNSPGGGGELTAFGQGFGQAFAPRSKIGEGFNKIRPNRGRIENPIEAREIYRRAAGELDLVAEEKQALTKAFENAGAEPTRKGVRFAEGLSAPKGRSRQALSSRQVQSRSGFLSARALSGPAQALNIGQFQADVIQANRELAKRLAESAQQLQEESLVRKEVSTGRLVKAIGDERNRFPT